jgi:hypothetical protein
MDVHLFGGKGECFAFNQAVARFLGGNPGIKGVVLVSTWRQALEARLSTAEGLLLSKAESLRLFDEKFAQTLEYLNRLGKQVYVWEPVPGATRSVPIALARAAWRHRSAGIEFTREQYFAENRFFFDALERHRDLVALRFSPSQALCASGRCAVTIEGVPAYFDNAHMTRSPYRFWARMMQDSEQRALTPVARAVSDDVR